MFFLADALTHESDPVAALKTYESRRLEPTSLLVKSNRKHGPEVVMQMAEERAPTGFKDITSVIPQAELE